LLPEPFTKPLDPDKLAVEFPNQILAKVKPLIEKQERERIAD